MSTPLSKSYSKEWSTALKKTITKMTNEELYTQFLIHVFSDRSLLYIQWVHTLYKHVLFRLDKPRLNAWFDDILFNPLDIEVVWAIPESKLNQDDLFLNYGQLRCFAKHGSHDESYGSHVWLTRPLASLDGFTLILFAELVQRYKMKFNHIIRPSYGQVEFRLSFASYPLTMDKSLVTSVRQQCFKHLVLASLVFPYLIVNVPNKEMKLFNGRSILDISLATTLAVVSDIMQYLAFQTTYLNPDRDWLFKLHDTIAHLSTRRDSYCAAFLEEVVCPCQFCSLLKSLFQKYYLIKLDDGMSQNLTNGNLILSYFYNKSLKEHKWYSEDENVLIQENFLKTQEKDLKECFQEISQDSASFKQYQQFQTDLQRILSKKRKYENTK